MMLWNRVLDVILKSLFSFIFSEILGFVTKRTLVSRVSLGIFLGTLAIWPLLRQYLIHNVKSGNMQSVLSALSGYRIFFFKYLWYGNDISKVGEKESALLLLYLPLLYQDKVVQYVLTKYKIQYDSFKVFARKAGDWCAYRKLLLYSSLSEAKIDTSILESVLNEAEDSKTKAYYIPPHTEYDDATSKFIGKLMNVQEEIIYYTATTGKTSQHVLEVFLTYKNNIQELNFYIADPRWAEHSALNVLLREYDIPLQAYDPKCLQDWRFDLIRRVINILCIINNLFKLNEQGVNVNLYLYNSFIPKYKTVFFKKSHYILLRPGILNYAKNTYSFGFNLAQDCHKDIMNQLMEPTLLYLTQQSAKVNMNLESIGTIEAEALSNLCYKLTECQVSIDQLEQIEPDLLQASMQTILSEYYFNVLKKAIYSRERCRIWVCNELKTNVKPD